MKFTKAIVRTPCRNYIHGISNAALGLPDMSLTLFQHETYCEALSRCGLELTILEPDEQYPDSTFVEDTAICTSSFAVITNPGAASRQGEITEIEKKLRKFYTSICRITDPGTLDGGDICQADDSFFIGISHRTNESGAQLLSDILRSNGFTTHFIDIRGISSLLHLKTGLTYIGDNRFIVCDRLLHHPALKGYELIPIDSEEKYAANCIRVNDHLLIPQGYPQIYQKLERFGIPLIKLDMSEFRKMDGGLSCLSLRF